MKENKAPDKLYIDSREHWRKSWTAFTTKAKGDDIEYIRKDVFVEKAAEWFEKNFNMPNDFKEHFKKAML